MLAGTPTSRNSTFQVSKSSWQAGVQRRIETSRSLKTPVSLVARSRFSACSKVMASPNVVERIAGAVQQRMAAVVADLAVRIDLRFPALLSFLVPGVATAGEKVRLAARAHGAPLFVAVGLHAPPWISARSSLPRPSRCD